jgi:rhamnosyltransferase
MGQPLKFSAPNKDNVTAIVVTYHPDSQFPERLRVIAEQVGTVLIVDNHSSRAEINMLEQCASCFNATLLKNTTNLGIAAGLNIGMAHAIRWGYEWALLFDQDTVANRDLVVGLRQAYEEFPAKGQLGLIGSNYTDTATGTPRKSTNLTGHAWIERRTVITSGTLLSVWVYQTLGAFREEYFIDCVDLEYCLRAKTKQLKVIMTTKPLMTHDVGHTTMHQIGWKKTGTSNHSPTRRYYMIRNQISMAKEYIFREPAWLALSFWTSFKSMVSICLFENQRVEKLKYAALGLLDGILSKFDRQLP